MTTIPATKSANNKAQSRQTKLELIPIPEHADDRIMELLYTLAMNGNISAAKLFLDCYRADPDDEPVFTREDAMKLLQEHLKQAA